MNSKFDAEVAHRLPLADAAFRLLDHAFDGAFLDGVFERHHGRSYEKTIAFPLFVQLVADSLLGHRGPSAHQAFKAAQADESLAASVQAMYAKLRRVPLPLSSGLFAEVAARLRAVSSSALANALPASLAAFWCLGFDGKKLKYVAKKLKAVRGLKGNIFGGKLLVVQDMATQQAVAAAATADGEAADNPLVPPVVAQVRALHDSRPRLWVGDRAFCDYKLLHLLSADDDHFLVRFNTSCGFHADPSVPVRTGLDDEKRPYREEWGCRASPKNPQRIRVRMITVTRGSDDPLILVTSLLAADLYPASDLLTAYRSRWGIEVMFQKVVQTFDLRHLIGGTAHATVFQAMICLVLYNSTLIIRDYAALAAAREPKTVSLHLLFDHLVRDLTAWVEVLGNAATLELLRATKIDGVAELRRYLQKILGTVWTDLWEKASTRKGRSRRTPRAYICGGHTSIDKILRGEHKEIPLKPSEEQQLSGAASKPPPYEATKDV
jgi:Transposase DDE domain